jgi:uncharacterized protein (DUF1501 family)
MQRRNFLKNSLHTALLPSLLGGLSVKAFGSSSLLNALVGAADNDHVLVLVALTGGNDGLNTIIPIEYYGDYAQIRSGIAIPQGSVLKLNNPKYNKFGFHPALTEMKNLFDTDKLMAIQSVGYPSPNGSHFRSTDIWLTGSDENQYLSSGWAGRFLSNQYPNFPVGFPNAQMPDPLAIQIGSTLSSTFLAPSGFTAIAVNKDLDFYNILDNILDTPPNTPSGKEITYLRNVARQTNKYADVIVNAAKKAQNIAAYPDTDLATQLKAVARLVAGGLKTKIYMVGISGFDTHAGQVLGGNPLAGSHNNLLKEVSDAIGAFSKDLASLGVSKRVMGMTFSEFGRRMQSNGSLGTDHGAAQPIFIFGDAVQNGILGNNPIIPQNTQAIDNVPMQYDFRSIYATILRDWFCVPNTNIETILLKNYQYLPFIKSTACNNTIDDLNNGGNSLIVNYPNPFANSTTITFKTNGGHTLVQIFDTTGRMITKLIDENYAVADTYTITFNAGQLAAGVYYARLQNGPIQQVRTMIKAR